MRDLEYIAGFFDGEGCVYAGPPNYQPRILMSQNNPEVLQMIQAMFGGNLRKHSNRKSWSLSILQTREILGFIDAIYPRSIIKRKELKVLKDLIEGSKSERPSHAARLKELKHG